MTISGGFLSLRVFKILVTLVFDANFTLSYPDVIF